MFIQMLGETLSPHFILPPPLLDADGHPLEYISQHRHG